MEPISETTLPEQSPAKRTRRRHSSAFKAEVLAACAEPGASIAAVAQCYQLNANLIHKWHKAARNNGQRQNEVSGFMSVPVSGPAHTADDLQVTFTLGRLTIRWPISQIERALPWLKALQA
jgi:transposase